jgi:universal stress protein E
MPAASADRRLIASPGQEERSMSQYQNILLFADPSMQRTAAFERAAALATAAASRLHLVLIDHNRVIEAASRLDRDQAAQAREGWMQIRRQWLATEAERLRSLGLEVTVEAIWDHAPREAMVACANERSPDLIVKDVRHEPLLKRAWLTPLDWHLLRDCQAPVLLVGASPNVLPKRIVAAVNVYAIGGSDDPALNQQIVKAALDLAIQCQADFHLTSAADFQMIQGDGLAMLGSWAPELHDELHRSHALALREFAAVHGIPQDRVHSISGWTPIALSQFAESISADVIVVGTHARRGLDRALMGSVAEAVVDAAPCDVLVTKLLPLP